MKKLISVLLVITLMSTMVLSFASAEEKVTIEILSLKTEEAAQNAFNEMFANFQEMYPNVEFDLQSMSSDNLKTTMRARAASGDMPDIVTWMKEIEPEYLMDLTGQAFLDNLNADTVAGANAIYDEGIYAMPIDNGYIALYYNKDVLAANNVELPTTLDEFRTVCETLVANGVSPFATGCLDLSVPYMGLIGLFAEIVYGTDPDWSANRDAGEVSFTTSEGWAKSFEYLKEFIYGYADPDNTFNMGYDESCAALANGEAAFLVQGSWALSTIRTANPDANIGLAAIPVFDDAENNKILAFPDTSMSITKDAKNADMALKFLEYMTSAEAGEIWSRNVAVSSAVNGVEVDYDPIASDVSYYLTSGKFTPYGDRVLRSIFTDKLWSDFSKVMLDTMTWDELAVELDTFWDKARDAE